MWRKTISSASSICSGTISCHVTAFFILNQSQAASFQHKHGALTSAPKWIVVEWLVESETKRQPSLGSMPITSVGTVWKFSASRDLQGLNCQMLLIDICGISLLIYYRMSLAWIWHAGWLRWSHCHDTMCCQPVKVFYIQSRRIDHKHGKILSDYQTRETLG